MTQTPSASEPTTGRIFAIDLYRGIALLAMASYHLLWDLADFGYLDPGYPATGWPKIYARAIAASFIFLAGFSLVLSHGNGIRWRPFWIRLAKIVLAAIVVTVATTLVMPRGLIYFGILHSIALSSLVGLAFLRVNRVLMVLLAALVIAAPLYVSHPLFDIPALWWVGLSPNNRPSFDYVPFLPWFGPFLLGMAAARTGPILRALRQSGLWITDHNPITRMLSFISRHSLTFYLVHQPVLISIVFAVTLVAPPAKPDPVASYLESCESGCADNEDQTLCKRFCQCTLEELQAENLFAPFQSGAISIDDNARIKGIAVECSSLSSSE